MIDTIARAPLRLASPAAAPDPSDLDDAESANEEAALASQAHLHQIAEDWALWVRTRSLYVRQSLPPSLLGRLTSRGTGRAPPGSGPDARNSAELLAFHTAFTAQPEDALDRRVFELHYHRRVRNIKAAALALGISRQHWYRLVRDARERIYSASLRILANNLEGNRRA